MVFSTYVEMILLNDSVWYILFSVLHVCGDDPKGGVKMDSKRSVLHVCGDDPIIIYDFI